VVFGYPAFRIPKGAQGGCVSTVRVVEFQSATHSYEEAAVAFSLARNAECIAALRHHRGFEAAALRTRANIRLRRFASAEKAIHSVRPQSGNLYECGVHFMLLGTILNRRGDQTRTNEAFFNARSYVLGYPSLALQTELAYYEAYAAILRRDFEAAKRIAVPALETQPLRNDEPHSYPLPVSRAFLHELLGFIDGHEGRFHEQIAQLNEGIASIDQLGYRDVWTESSLLWNLAEVVKDLHLPSIAGAVRARAASLPWTDETAFRAYEVYRALGWHSALSGDSHGAMKDLLKADGHAHSPAWRIEALLDRAYLLHELHEPVSAYDRLDEAYRIAQGVNWNDYLGDERIALLWLAENMALHGMPTATTMVDKYKAISKPIDAHLTYATDKRYRGRELDALGTVAAVTGQKIRGLTMLHDALAIWESLGFAWRAAKTARVIARITQNDIDVADARRRAAPWPNSWLAKVA
jgi:tetratricopeptide (TPR) repeat protein